VLDVVPEPTKHTGLEEEGLFRRSPNSVLLKQVQEAYDRGIFLLLTLDYMRDTRIGQVVSLRSFNDPHLAAVLLKKYLRDLPEPVFPESLYPHIRRCPTPTNDQADVAAASYIRDTILPQLMPCMYILLSNVFRELRSCYILGRRALNPDYRPNA
jgi:Rho GTPase-activating protein 1